MGWSKWMERSVCDGDLCVSLAMVPRSLFKHLSRCNCEDVFLGEINNQQTLSKANYSP